MELKLNIKLNYVLLPAGVLVGLILAVGLTSMAEDSELDTGPRAIPYNGILEFNGQALNGQADLRFTLTDDPSGENVNCLYTEEHDNVTAYSGRFSVNIGSIDTTNNSLDPCIFDSEAMYIEVGVRDAAANEDGDDTNDEYVALTGSQRIHPVPFSYWAAEGSDFKVDGNLTVSGGLLLSGDIEDSNGNFVDVNDGFRVTNDVTVGSDGTGSLTVNGNINVSGDIQNSNDVVYVADGLHVQDGLIVGEDGTGNLVVNGTGTADRLTLTTHSNSEPMLLFDNNTFDSNADLGSMGDYKLVLREEATAATSYGFGIQSATLFANANGNIDLKINGSDVVNVATGGVNITGQTNISGNLNLTGQVISLGSSVAGTGSKGCLRLGAIQQCWGAATDDDVTQTFDRAFGDGNVRIVITGRNREMIVTTDGVTASGFDFEAYNSSGNSSAVETGEFHWIAFGSAGSNW